MVEAKQRASGADWVADLCAFLRAESSSGEALTLEKLAERTRMSPFHLQRKFKAAVGLTPKQYLEACRMEKFKQQLKEQKTVTEATYEAGFGSSRGVYERVDTRLGMTPATYRQGAEKMAISWACEETPFGLLGLAATDRGLCFVQFGETESELATEMRGEFPQAALTKLERPYPEQFDWWMAALRRYLQGEQVSLDLPLDVQGTAFQWRVWHFLQKIPEGEVRSYAQVAAGIGQPSAARAVGHACATNKVSLVIPCHRVLRGDGQLGGYRWGLDRKQRLLERERVVNRRV